MSLSVRAPIYTAGSWLVAHTIFLNNRNEGGENPEQYSARNTPGSPARGTTFPSSFISFMSQVNLFWFHWFIYKVGIIIIPSLPQDSLFGEDLRLFQIPLWVMWHRQYRICRSVFGLTHMNTSFTDTGTKCSWAEADPAFIISQSCSRSVTG